MLHRVGVLCVVFMPMLIKTKSVLEFKGTGSRSKRFFLCNVASERIKIGTTTKSISTVNIAIVSIKSAVH